MTATNTFRKLLLRVLLVFLVVTAIVAIASVWTDIDPNGRILGSAAVISFAGLFALTGAAQLDRNRTSAIGVATLLLSSAAAGLTLYLIWANPHERLVENLWLSAWLWTLATSLHSLVSLARLPARARWLGVAAPLVSYFATIFTTGLIFDLIEADQHAYYLLATAYILTTLASLTVLIVHLLHGKQRVTPITDTLTLVAVDGDVYEDPGSAKRYRVTAIN